MTTKIQKCPTCGGDAVDRSEFWECCVDNAANMQECLFKIKKAIRKYHLALDGHKHGGIAAHRALDNICHVLDMEWERGKTTEWLAERPSLKTIYEEDN
ncbi:hypothetical protein ACWU37_20955 (plasmid) [Photobacterium damselae subsp. damselae]